MSGILSNGKENEEPTNTNSGQPNKTPDVDEVIDRLLRRRKAELDGEEAADGSSE